MLLAVSPMLNRGFFQAANVNSKSLRSLIGATDALAKTLEDLARTIQAGIEEYPAGSQESSRVKDVVLGSNPLLERVNRLKG